MLGARSVPRSTNTSARRCATGRDSSIQDWLVKASQLVDQTHFKFVDVSYSGLVNFPLQILWSSGFRPGEFGDHRVRETKSGTFRSRRATVSMRQCTVRFKDNTKPWDFRYGPMSGSSFLARRLSR